MRRLAPLLALLALAAPACADDLLGEAATVDREAEVRVHDLLARALAEDGPAFDAEIAALAALDDARREADLPRTGLLDDAHYLAAALAPSRDARRAALEAVLRAHPDPTVRRLAEHRLEDADDAAKADQLLADDRHNRRAELLNDAVRPLGVFSPTAFLAAINPLLLAGSAVDSIATTAVNLWNYNRLSTAEREALVRYRTELAREPDTADAPAIARAIRRLGEKRAKVFCTETVAAATQALDAGDLDRARFYVDSALATDHCTDAAATSQERLARLRNERAAREEAARWPVDEPPAPEPDETEDHYALVAAVALGDPAAMAEAGNRFLARHEDSALAPGVRYAVAVARDLGGHRELARDAVTALARDHRSDAGRHAAALAASPEWNRLGALADAESAHSRDVARYVLLGRQMDGRTALYSALQIGADSVRGAQSFGIFNVIGLATRAWSAWRKDPASNQAIIDRGEDFLAREPDSADAPAVHARLADAYERAGNFGRALMHCHATPAPDPKRVAKLEGKLAETLLAEADQRGGDPDLLRLVAHGFPETAAGKTALERIEKLPGAGEITITREILDAQPALAGPAGLDLPPALLDRRRANGEIADAGVTLANGALKLTLRDPAGGPDTTETRPLAPDAWARARAAAESALYGQALAKAKEDPEAGKYEKYIPIYVTGSIDESGGVYVYPGVKLRRYHSPDAPLYQ